MHLILTGATGMVGSAALSAMVRNPKVSKISILSRKAVPQASDTAEASKKCVVHVHDDFSKPPSPDVLAQLKGAHGCVWALGVSVTDVSKEAYEAITLEYPLTFAKTLATLGDAFNFVYVSGEGATTSPGSCTARFGVVKGQAESSLLSLSKEAAYAGKLRVYSARPGGVDVSQHPEIQPYWKGRIPIYKNILYTPLFPVMRTVYKDMVSPTKELGDALVKLASGDGQPLPDGKGIEGEGRTLANSAIRRLMGI